MRKIFTIFLLVSMMCVSICGCSSASARQETLLTIEEKTEVDALETAITATDANQTIEEPEEEAVRHTEGVDGFSDDIDYLSIMKQSCLNGDYEAGVVAEKARNKKIDVLGLNVTKVFFEDLLELSKIITAECGDKRYFRIGETKLRKIVSENKDADFVLWNGTRPQIKRTKFERFVDQLNLI